jgi:hypothetical protein
MDYKSNFLRGLKDARDGKKPQPHCYLNTAYMNGYRTADSNRADVTKPWPWWANALALVVAPFVAPVAPIILTGVKVHLALNDKTETERSDKDR